MFVDNSPRRLATTLKDRSNASGFNIYTFNVFERLNIIHTQPAITCSKLAIETLEQGVKYVLS